MFPRKDTHVLLHVKKQPQAIKSAWKVQQMRPTAPKTELAKGPPSPFKESERDGHVKTNFTHDVTFANLVRGDKLELRD